MKVIDVTIQDGKLCAQLLNFLKVAKAPDNMTVNDCLALNETMKWFNDLVKGIALELQSKSAGPSVKPALPILPVKKAELAKYKKKGKK